jgi:hypothetical protein
VRGAPQRAAGLFFSVTSPALPDDGDVFAAEPGQPLRGRLLLANYSLYQRFQVACLVDYRQIPCGVDGVDVPMGDERALPFAIPAQAEGMHQLLILAFYTPAEQDEGMLLANSRFLHAHRRAWLQVGRASPGAPPRAPARVASVLSREARRGFNLFQLVAGHRGLNLQTGEWAQATSHSQVALPYTAMLTNPREDSVDVLLLPFLDFRLLPPPEPEAGFIRIRRISGAAVPLVLQTTLDPGPHQLQVLAVTSPYAEPDAMRGRAIQGTLMSSGRVLIQVEP